MLDNRALRETFYGHGLIVSNKRATAVGPQSTLGGIGMAARGVRAMMSRRMSRPPVAEPEASTPAPAARADHPNYLSGRSMALALIGSLDPAKPLPEIPDLQDAVEKLPPSKIRDILLSSLTEAGGDLNKLRTSIAAWFDDSMERLSGAYKRQLKWISMLIGLVVAIAFNADRGAGAKPKREDEKATA